MSGLAPVDSEEWSDGPRLDVPGLADSVLAIWQQAAALSGEDDTAIGAPHDVAGAEELLGGASTWLVGILETTGGGSDGEARRSEAARLLVRHGEIAAEVRQVPLTRRIRGFARVHAALGRLRGAGSVDQMIERAPAEVARCGFDRVMVARVEGTVATPAAVHVVDDPQAAARILEVGRSEPSRIDHLLLESEMLRRRGPVLVSDAQNDPRVHATLAAATGTRSYVAAPIIPQGKVVGFIHADCYAERRTVDEFDRDLLWMFAEGFGHAYERTVLLQRLRALRQEVRRANHSILAVMDEFCDADVEVARGNGDEGVARSAAAMFVTPDNRIDSLLTARELDVIRLLATGATNGEIATKLVVAEGTVKSHVKHILRKLRASNRAEAVSRYIRLVQQGGSEG